VNDSGIDSVIVRVVLSVLFGILGLVLFLGAFFLLYRPPA
jgi:hypothetical protein